MAQVAITYPAVTLTEMNGAFLKRVLEDVADNLFHPDPYYQQGWGHGAMRWAAIFDFPFGSSRVAD